MTSVTRREKRRNWENYGCDVTSNLADSNLGQDDWIVATHPGLNNSLKCHICNTIIPTNSAFSKHLRATHHITKICYKCLCGFNSENSHSVGIHKRYCTGNLTEEHSLAIKCPHCKCSTQFEPGLFVHMARVHPSLHDENLKEKTKNFLWSEPKFQLLAETIIELKSKKVKDTDLASSKIFGRSSQATQKI